MKNALLYPEITTRRGFVKMGAIGASAAVAATASRSTAAERAQPDVWVLHGPDNRKLMQKAMNIIQENGWFGDSVKTLALKVNAGWARTPEEGANTHPDLVDVFIDGAKKGGVQKIVLPENPCNNAKIAFERSGIAAVAKSHKCKMIDLKTSTKDFREVEIPGGKNIITQTVTGNQNIFSGTGNVTINENPKSKQRKR